MKDLNESIKELDSAYGWVSVEYIAIEEHQMTTDNLPKISFSKIFNSKECALEWISRNYKKTFPLCEGESYTYKLYKLGGQIHFQMKKELVSQPPLEVEKAVEV